MGEFSASFPPSLELELFFFLHKESLGLKSPGLNTCYQIKTASVFTECWWKLFESSGSALLHCHPMNLFWELSISLCYLYCEDNFQGPYTPAAIPLQGCCSLHSKLHGNKQFLVQEVLSVFCGVGEYIYNDILQTLPLSSCCQLEGPNIKARSHLLLKCLCCLIGPKHL